MPFHLSVETASAAHVASLLVHSMGDAFDSDDDDRYGDGQPMFQRRSRAISRCLERLFLLYTVCSETMIKGAFEYHRAGGAIAAILRVDKDEVGWSPTGEVWAAEGNPYMHISRAYYVWVGELKRERHEDVEKALAHGAPTFLLCVMGKFACVWVYVYDLRLV